MTAYGGADISVLGQVSLYVEFGSLSPFPFTFYVTSRGTNLLGIDLFDRLGFRIVEASSGLVVQSVRGLDRKAQWSDVFNGLDKVKLGFLSLPDGKSNGNTGTAIVASFTSSVERRGVNGTQENVG